MTQGRESVTIEDVARRAGVARGTVSNVLNHPDRVAPSTRAAVHAAITELRFVRNSHARSLASGRSSTIGLVLTDLENSFFVDMAQGAEERAAEHGLALLLANSHRSQARQRMYLDLFDEARVAGTLLAPYKAMHAGAELVRTSRPVIALNVAVDSAHRCSVAVDNELGGYIAARHLIDTGRRHIAYVGGPEWLDPLRERRLGVERAVREAGGAVQLTQIIVESVRTPQGRWAAREILALPPSSRPDGIAAASDLLALGMVQVLHDRVSIPHDMAIIGYDDNAAARESIVPISTIAQPGREIGRTGADLLWDELTVEAHAHVLVRLPPRVVVRQSTAASAQSTAGTTAP